MRFTLSSDARGGLLSASCWNLAYAPDRRSIVQELAWLTSPSNIVSLGIFLGAFTAGFAGFGLAAAAGAFLLHVIEPQVAVPLMMVCSVAVQVSGVLYLRSSVRFDTALGFILGGVAGIPVALLALRGIDAQLFRSLFGCFLVAYTGWTLARMHLPARPRAALASGARTPPAPPCTSNRKWRLTQTSVGFLAGIVGGLKAMPGALLSIWADMTGMSKSQQRGIVQPFILSMQVCALLMLVTASPTALPEVSPYLVGAIVPSYSVRLADSSATNAPTLRGFASRSF